MIKIVPKPLLIEYPEGNGKFVFDDSTEIKAVGDTAQAARELACFLGRLGIKRGENTTKIVLFSISPELSCEEYLIDIRENISVTAGSFAGALYAALSLKQAIASTDNALPHCIIRDKPKYAYRGFMIDTGRYYYPPHMIYKLIDIMLECKLNVLHWHISEDQGWRFESDNFPLLTEKGSRRSHTNFSPRPHDGYYTKAEMREIVSYCAKRNITVIPELDIPGHTQALIACYPHLGCFGRKLPVATHWGVKHDILCAGKDSTYEFVKTIIDEMLEVFPSEYFHIGGDEAVKLRWKLCPHCRARIRELGLKDENALQAHFTNVIADYLKSKGRKAIIWNEYEFSDICDNDIIWQVWNPEERIFEKIGKDRRTFINSKSSPYYLDLTYKTNPLKETYLYDPDGDVKEGGLMLGSEACLWSEFVPTMNKALKMIFPRLSAIAERIWSEGCDYEDFITRLEAQYRYLRLIGIKPRKSIRAANSKTRGFFEELWFTRRMLYWAGLHNAIDDFLVSRKYGENAENAKKGRKNGK